MENKEMTLEERYAKFAKEAETIKDELCKVRQNGAEHRDIIERLEKLVQGTLEDSQLRNTDFWWGPLSRLKWAIQDFKKDEVSLEDLIEYVWVAFDWATGLRLQEAEKKEMEKRADDIRIFCLECAENSAYPEKVRNFFQQCAENAQGLTKIVDIYN